MTVNVKYSFVMPLFNAELWLDKAIESILSQSLSNWELLCVDDGSTDNTVEKIKYYMEISDKVRLYSQENSGPAVAREKAINEANGDYVVYVDSDDFIEQDYLLNIDKQSVHKPDIIIPELMSQQQDGKYVSFNKARGLAVGSIFTGLQAFRKTFPWEIHGFACYKTELMKEHASGENANYNRYNSDEYITRVVFLHSKVITISDGMYYHTANLESLTKKPSLRKLDFLNTERKLLLLAMQFDPDYVDTVKSDTIRKIFLSLYNFEMHKCSFTKSEWEKIKKSHRALYNEIFSKGFEYKPHFRDSTIRNLSYILFSKYHSVVFVIAKIKKSMKK